MIWSKTINGWYENIKGQIKVTWYRKKADNLLLQIIPLKCVTRKRNGMYIKENCDHVQLGALPFQENILISFSAKMKKMNLNRVWIHNL